MNLKISITVFVHQGILFVYINYFSDFMILNIDFKNITTNSKYLLYKIKKFLLIIVKKMEILS